MKEVILCWTSRLMPKEVFEDLKGKRSRPNLKVTEVSN